MSNPAKTFTLCSDPRVPMRRLLAALSILAVLVTSLLLTRSVGLSAADGPVAYDAPQPARARVQFTPNHGQMHPSVLVQAQSGGASFFFGRDALSLRTSRPASPDRCGRRHLPDHQDQPLCFVSDTVLLRFDGARPDAGIRFEEELPTVLHFMRGKDPARWAVDVPTYSAIAYTGIYEGIDLRLRGIPSGIRMSFRVKPGADPGRIRLHPEGLGADQIFSGVSVRTRGTKPDHIPATFSEQDGAVSIAVGAYDPAAPLEIDADIELERSTYLGGSRNDQIEDIAMHPAANALGFVGWTESSNWPTANPFQAEKGSAGTTTDAVFGMIDIERNEVLWSTYFGGARADSGSRMAIGPDGRLHYVGSTSSTDLPTVDAYQDALGGIGSNDAFYARLSPAGTDLEYSTYFGGRGTESAADLMVDDDGNLWLTGKTDSADLPLAHAIDSSRNGGEDMYIVRLNRALNSPDFSTYYGGSDNDEGVAIVDRVVDGRVTIAGTTQSSNFPIIEAIQGRLASSGSHDVTIVTIDTRSAISDDAITTQPLVTFSTYFGGRGNDDVSDIEGDDAGGVGLVGSTASLDFPLHEAIDGSRGGRQDAFFAWLKPQTATEDAEVLMSTLIGGRDDEHGNELEWDGVMGLWHVAGDTRSTDFPTLRAVQGSRRGDTDAFLYGINAAGLDLVYGTYLGGSAADTASALAFEAPNALWVAGSTSSRDLPIVDPIQEGVVGEQDAWIARLLDLAEVLVTPSPTTAPPTPTTSPTDVPATEPPVPEPTTTDAPPTATSPSPTPTAPGATVTPSLEPSPTVATQMPTATQAPVAAIYLPRITKP